MGNLEANKLTVEALINGVMSSPDGEAPVILHPSTVKMIAQQTANPYGLTPPGANSLTIGGVPVMVSPAVPPGKVIIYTPKGQQTFELTGISYVKGPVMPNTTSVPVSLEYQPKSYSVPVKTVFVDPELIEKLTNPAQPTVSDVVCPEGCMFPELEGEFEGYVLADQTQPLVYGDYAVYAVHYEKKFVLARNRRTGNGERVPFSTLAALADTPLPVKPVEVNDADYDPLEIRTW